MSYLEPRTWVLKFWCLLVMACAFLQTIRIVSILFSRFSFDSVSFTELMHRLQRKKYIFTCIRAFRLQMTSPTIVFKWVTNRADRIRARNGWCDCPFKYMNNHVPMPSRHDILEECYYIDRYGLSIWCCTYLGYLYFWVPYKRDLSYGRSPSLWAIFSNEVWNSKERNSLKCYTLREQYNQNLFKILMSSTGIIFRLGCTILVRLDKHERE